MFIPLLKIENTFLCPLSEDCWKYFFKWFNDYKILVYMGDYSLGPFTEKDARQYVQATVRILGLFA